MFSFQEWCTDPCDMVPCIIMLKHEVMAADEWHGNEPQDLVTVSLCIQIAIDKMQNLLLMPAHTITLPPPWGTLFTMLTLANHSPYMLSAICPGTVETGIHP